MGIGKDINLTGGTRNLLRLKCW